MAGADRLQATQVLSGNGQHHPLLGFAEPQLPRPEAGVFDRDIFKLHPGTDRIAHLAHCGGKATGAAVGDGRVEPLVPSL